MKKYSLILSIFLFLLLPFSDVSGERKDELKAAFIKKDDLWIKNDQKEIRITDGKYVRYPKWSYNGEWLAYLSGKKQEYGAFYTGDLWLYHIKSKRSFKLSTNVSNNFQWSPNQNSIAYQIEKDLKMINVKTMNKPVQLSTGILVFSWLPEGNGFLVASKISENVFSDIVLSKINIKSNNHFVKKHFYTIHVAKKDYFYDTSQFKWSHDRNWIAFEIEPTGSLSADSNVLSVISSNATNFHKIDEMLHYEEWFQWAPANNYLAFIKGDNRVSTINKKLAINKVANTKLNYIYTPKGFVDRDLNWKSNHQIYVSRSIEKDLVDISKRPMPSIYQINLKNNMQKKVTFPLLNEGDFFPESVNNGNNLLWIRTNRKEASVLVSNLDGSGQVKWIPKLDLGTWYYEHWEWSEVFNLYQK